MFAAIVVGIVVVLNASAGRMADKSGNGHRLPDISPLPYLLSTFRILYTHPFFSIEMHMHTQHTKGRS